MLGQLARVLQYALKIQNGAPAPALISSVCEAVFDAQFSATVSRQLAEATIVLPDEETMVLLFGVDGKTLQKSFWKKKEKVFWELLRGSGQVKMIFAPLASTAALVAAPAVYGNPDVFDGLGISPRHRLVPRKMQELSEYAAIKCNRFGTTSRTSLFVGENDLIDFPTVV